MVSLMMLLTSGCFSVSFSRDLLYVEQRWCTAARSRAGSGDSRMQWSSAAATFCGVIIIQVNEKSFDLKEGI